MKKLFIFSAALIVAISANAQITFNERGKMMIGTNPTTEWEQTHNYRDTTTMVRIFGEGEHGSNVRISFGDQASEWGYNVLVGEQGATDTDRLWLHGKFGLAYTIGTGIPDTLFNYDVNQGNYLKFNCDVRTTGVFVASDSRFKENIEPIENSLDGLKSLSAVSYNLKPRFTANRSAAGVGADDEKAACDKKTFDAFYAEQQNDPVRFGLIAQQVKEVYPELVRTDKDGYMYVDYIGLVPLLVDAINQLQAEISDLKCPKNSDEIAKKVQKSNDADLDDILQPRLYQNAPNPFSASTEIRFALPESVASATIYIYDLQGKQIKGITLADRGEAAITLQASELKPGMYIYALIADGQEIASRRMIITE